MSPRFPAWLGTQKRLYHIIPLNVRILDTIPEWLWKFSPQLGWLDLSRNKLKGKLPTPLSFCTNNGNQLREKLPWTLYFGTFHGRCMEDLSFNRLEGHYTSPLPLWYNLTFLHLGNNRLLGPISFNIGELSSLRVLALFGNLLNGGIPSSLIKL